MSVEKAGELALLAGDGVFQSTVPSSLGTPSFEWQLWSVGAPWLTSEGLIPSVDG